MEMKFWNAIVSCDQTYDGIFYYGVRTTGIFCRPSCPSRTPKQENVTIYADSDTPVRDGLRPCKRCRPDELLTPSIIQTAQAYLADHLADEMTLGKLAEKLYISPFHLQRIFKDETNTSPSKYLQDKRVQHAKQLILETELPIHEIAYAAGFKNAAHFLAVFKKKTSLSPTEFRSAH
ncbi:bifunctional transcriptional activator/DNA repair enzyme AdaA [Peribacillus frigoritolerans]|uniref:bifunctional transcriptional activator/DNA repair enzyme AdaA n=1 Tax=Peribacillus frigoritolerans TaxID=450367 RepID=UPI00105A5176|nr:Ada metal-binding domain-containing protein [Peribacillus frigoritolerans]TDL80353.1 methylphosphotriester-DNA--protein-cysteine methyltransferase family protein [Peribacillus frigoritolerans]